MEASNQALNLHSKAIRIGAIDCNQYYESIKTVVKTTSNRILSKAVTTWESVTGPNSISWQQ